MTKKEVADRYWKMAVSVAEAVSKISDAQRTAEHLADEMRDNADPECDLAEVLIKCARALSSIVIYASEYEEEAKNEEAENE